MRHSNYRRALNGLGILKDQRPQVYNNPISNSFSFGFSPLDLQKGLEVARKYGFTDVLVTDDHLLIFTGPAEAIYRLSPRAAIEKKLNPFMNLATEQQVMAFWNTVYASVYPGQNITFNTLQDVMTGPQAPNVIPHPGVPDTKFYSVANNRFYGGSKDAIDIPLCRVNGGEQYSKADGPIIIRSPAGEMVSVMHSFRFRDLKYIEECGGLAWSSFAVNQGVHSWPSDITFYLDANILRNNLSYGMTFKPWRRQKAVQIAAWDNLTLSPGRYVDFEIIYKKGIRNGGNGSGFLAAEYLAVGLDTTNFEEGHFYKLSRTKGAVHPIHNWSDMDNSLRNLNAAKTTMQFIPSRFKDAKYDTMGVKSYVELKVIDFIPLSDIPLAVIQVHPNIGDLYAQSLHQAQEAEERLKKAGFEGKILFVQYNNREDKTRNINYIVNEYSKKEKKIAYVAPQSSSGIFKRKNEFAVKTRLKPMILPNGLIMSNIEVTQHLYESITGKNPSHFTGVNNPVESVSWYNAIEFCNKFTRAINSRWGTNLKEAYSINGKDVVWDKTADGWRLPTAEEWIYAAKGGMRDFVLPTQNAVDYAWFSENSNGTTHPVGEKIPNNYGLYDMMGNVGEWCWTGDDAYRTLYDGGWESYVRSADRRKVSPSYANVTVGFRICRNGPGYTPIGD